LITKQHYAQICSVVLTLILETVCLLVCFITNGKNRNLAIICIHNLHNWSSLESHKDSQRLLSVTKVGLFESFILTFSLRLKRYTAELLVWPKHCSALVG